MSTVVSPEISEINIPIDAELVGTFQPRREYGVSFREELGLSLLDTDYTIYRTLETDGERFDVIPSYPPINGDRLVLLLDEIAPNKNFRQGAGGIEADWNILDKPDSKKATIRVGQAQGLVRLHQQLGQPWVEFTRSQPAFISTLRDSMHPYPFSFPGMNGSFSKLTEQARYSKIVSEYVNTGASSLDRFIERLEAAGVKGADRFVLTAVAKSSITRNRKHRQLSATPQNEAELRRRFSAANLTKRIGLLDNIVNLKLSPDQKNRLVNELKTDYDWGVFSGNEIAWPKADMDEGVTLADAFANPHVHTSGPFEIDAVSILKSDGSVYTLPISTARKVRTGSTILPHISWRRDREGQRSFIFERYVVPSPEGETRHVDGVLGALVLAYVQPEQRSDWPKTFKIGQRKQEMEAAQVPVLALMKSRSILNGPFVEAAESR